MSCSSREKDSPGDLCGPVGNRGFCLKMPFFLRWLLLFAFYPWTQSWQGHSELRHLEYPLLLEFSHCQREVSLSRRIWDSCSVVVICYSPICLKKGSKCKAVWVEWAFLVLLLLFFSQDLYPGMEEFFWLEFLSLPWMPKASWAHGWCKHHSPERKFWGEWGGICRFYPKKDEDSVSLAIRNCLVSNSDSAGAPQEILQKSSIHSWTACGTNPHFP